MKALIGFVTLALALGACNRRGDGDERLSTAQSSGISFTMRIQPECQTNTATVNLSAPHAGQSYNTQMVPHGGSGYFQVMPGTYTLSASTSTGCQVSQTIQATLNDNSPYQICLGNTCNTTTGLYGFFKAASASGVPCAWGVYGCQGHLYPGEGNVLLSQGSLFFSAKAEASVLLDLEFTLGNHAVAAIPSLGAKGWQARAKPDGKIRVGEADYDSLVYDAQIAEGRLQFDEGFCASREQIVAQMTEYLALVGFGERATTEFSRRWQGHIPPNPILCAYPQTEAQISRVVAYKSATTHSSKKLWFVLVPQLEDAVSRIRPIPKNLSVAALKPQKDALAAAKKTPADRKVANEAELLVEEWGLAFLLER